MARHGFLIIGSLLFVLLFLSPMILADQVQFLELAKDVPDDRLHAALHSYNDGKFKHGIFPGDRTALEAVHRERAADATALVLLAKRQSTNTTISTTHTTTTTSSTTTSSTTTRLSSSSPSTTTTTHTTTGPASSTSNTDPTSTTPQPSSTPSQSTRSTTLRTTKTITGENGQPSTTTEFTVVVEQATDDGTPSPTPEPSQTPGPPGMQQPSNGVEGLKVRWIEAAGAAGAAALVFFML